MRPLSLSAATPLPEQRRPVHDRAVARTAPRTTQRMTACPVPGNVAGVSVGSPGGGRSIAALRTLDEVAQHGRSTRTLATELRWRCAPALAEVTFPAARWQLVIAADQYGADAGTRALLGRLPIRSYPSFTAVVATLVTQLAPAPRDEDAPTAAP